MYKNWSIGFIRIFILVNVLGVLSIVTTYYSVSTIKPSVNWNSPTLNISFVKWLFFPLFLAFTYYVGYVFVSTKLKFNLKNYVNIFLTFCIGLLIDALLSVGFLGVLYVLKEIFRLIYLTSQ